MLSLQGQGLTRCRSKGYAGQPASIHSLKSETRAASTARLEASSHLQACRTQAARSRQHTSTQDHPGRSPWVSCIQCPHPGKADGYPCQNWAPFSLHLLSLSPGNQLQVFPLCSKYSAQLTSVKCNALLAMRCHSARIVIPRRWRHNTSIGRNRPPSLNDKIPPCPHPGHNRRRLQCPQRTKQPDPHLQQPESHIAVSLLVPLAVRKLAIRTDRIDSKIRCQGIPPPPLGDFVGKIFILLGLAAISPRKIFILNRLRPKY